MEPFTLFNGSCMDNNPRCQGQERVVYIRRYYIRKATLDENVVEERQFKNAMKWRDTLHGIRGF
jgi:hypothetical protein